jgi:hypothetical protein
MAYPRASTPRSSTSTPARSDAEVWEVLNIFKQIPSSIDGPLAALGSRSDLSPITRATLESISRSILRAFAGSGLDRPSLERALDKVRKCLPDGLHSELVDPRLVPDLRRLAEHIEGELNGGFPAVPSPATMTPPVRVPVMARAPVIAPVAASIHVEAPAAVAAQPVPRPSFPRTTRANASALFSKLGSQYSRRSALLVEPRARWSDLLGVDEQIADWLRSIEWIADRFATGLAADLLDVESPTELFAATLALLQTNQVAPVLSYLTPERAISRAGLAAVVAAIRLSAPENVSGELRAALVALVGHSHAAPIALLVDRGEISTDWLVSALEDREDAVASEAAELLAWLGFTAAHASQVEARALRAAGPGRRCAALFAAAALGSWRALDELRRMVDAEQLVTQHAIDGLVIAGGADDVSRLIGLASRQPELAMLAVLGVGQLGDAASAPAIGAAAVDDEIKRQAARAIFGDRPPGRGDDSQERSRLLRGEPWTLAGALSRLSAPDELLPARRWHALEIGTRSGVRPQLVLDSRARSQDQLATAAGLRAAVASPLARRPAQRSSR